VGEYLRTIPFRQDSKLEKRGLKVNKSDFYMKDVWGGYDRVLMV